MSKYLVLDLETGFKEVHGRKGNFYYNPIVALGLKAQGLDQPITVYGEELSINRLIMLLGNYSIIIGHNIKYDLLYLWKYPGFQEWLGNGGRVFDTMLAEYILTGQKHKYPALRDIAVNKYGCKERTKYMEEYWDKGIDTTEIPKEIVLEDVKNDVSDTESIMIQQIGKLKIAGQYHLAMESMEGLLATTEMEYNGLFIDGDVFNKNRDSTIREILETKEELGKLIPVELTGMNFASNDELSILFFGGSRKVTVKIPQVNELGEIVRIKTGENRGNIKYKNEKTVVRLDGFGIKPKSDWELKKIGIYSTDEKVLKVLAKKHKTNAGKVALYMLQLKKLQKSLGTYYDGFAKLLYPDGCIRGSIGHVGTDTGRTNSSRPNLQNITK